MGKVIVGSALQRLLKDIRENPHRIGLTSEQVRHISDAKLLQYVVYLSPARK